jgi:putative glutamine amidotransferase
MNLQIVAITMGFRPSESVYRISEDYITALEGAGAIAVALPHIELGISNPKCVLDLVRGLILAGGSDLDPIHYKEEPRVQLKMIDPIRDAFEMAICREAMSRDMPILAICRGMQVLNVAAGGTLYQDVTEPTREMLLHEQNAPRWHPTHDVVLTHGSVLGEILGCGKCRVNSFHHQTIREIAPGFVGCAKASDGTVEAIENPDSRFMIGVQWHPENLAQRSAFWLRLFERFVVACHQGSAAL